MEMVEREMVERATVQRATWYKKTSEGALTRCLPLSLSRVRFSDGTSFSE